MIPPVRRERVFFEILLCCMKIAEAMMNRSADKLLSNSALWNLVYQLKAYFMWSSYFLAFTPIYGWKQRRRCRSPFLLLNLSSNLICCPFHFSYWKSVSLLFISRIKRWQLIFEVTENVHIDIRLGTKSCLAASSGIRLHRCGRWISTFASSTILFDLKMHR